VYGVLSRGAIGMDRHETKRTEGRIKEERERNERKYKQIEEDR
jgi:hypothetical protein